MSAKKTSLSKYAQNIYSQTGEDGILQQIFKIIKVEDPWCVEFGAWDGIVFSNTRALIEQNWRAVLIEPNTRKFAQLKKNNEGNDRVHLLKEFVSFSGKNSLDELLSSTPIPKTFDLLSIDIDGNDYHIWNSLKTYKPKVVIIEFNETIPPDIEFIQPKDFSINQGNSLKSLINLGKEKQYELIACTETNAIFVTKFLFPLFKISGNSVQKLHQYKYPTRLYQLFDGTIKIDGNTKLLWSNIHLTENDYQVLPVFFRRFPEGVKNILLLKLYQQWHRLKGMFSS